MINNNEQQYLNILQELVDLSEKEPISKDRTGIGTYRIFGRTLDFDLSDNKIPLLTTKKINYNTILYELIWMFILKNPNTNYLDDNNIKIWKNWYANKPNSDDKTVGEMYGQVLRNFKYDFSNKESDKNIDQLDYVINLLKEVPHTRRAVFTLFDPRAVADERLTFQKNVDLGRGVLNNCHGVINQFIINNKNELEFFTYQRSNDFNIGSPLNHAFYATLAHLVAHILGIKATRMIYSMGDVHLYSNSIEQAKLQLTRQPFRCPSIVIDKDIKEFDDLKDPIQIKLINYQHHPFIKMNVAV